MVYHVFSPLTRDIYIHHLNSFEYIHKYNTIQYKYNIFINRYAKCVTVMTELKCLARFMSDVTEDLCSCHVAL